MHYINLLQDFIAERIYPKKIKVRRRDQYALIAVMRLLDRLSEDPKFTSYELSFAREHSVYFLELASRFQSGELVSKYKETEEIRLLPLSARVINSLSADGIQTVSEILKLKPLELVRLPELGLTSIVELTTLLAGLGKPIRK